MVADATDGRVWRREEAGGKEGEAGGLEALQADEETAARATPSSRAHGAPLSLPW